MNSKSFFDYAFDTFKAFDNLTVENSGLNQDEFPTSIWQILQHIIAWQAFQLGQLQKVTSKKLFKEETTWREEKYPPSDAVLQAAVEEFKEQLASFQTALAQANITEQQDLENQKIIQEVALHLAFHLGEVVLIRRLKGSYPLPHQMKTFLQA